jgi:hypothetical protein
MMMKNRTTTNTLVAVMAMATLFSCSSKERKISQGIMPVALNFYVLTGEIVRIRADVKAASPEKLADFITKYQECILRSQQLQKEAGAVPEMKKHQDFQSSLDLCLTSQLAFLGAEASAAKAYGTNRKAQKQIADIEQQISGNSLARARNQAELDRLKTLASQSLREVEAARPVLASASQANLRHMRTYNQLVLSQKILNYTSREELFALLEWEKAKPAAPKASAKKKPKRR